MDYEERYADFISACESYMDQMELELAMDVAFESENEQSNTNPSASASKLRNGLAKFRKGDKNGKKEFTEAVSELSEAEKEAETPEEKKKISTAVKIGLAAIAAAAAAVGGVKIAKKAKEAIQKRNQEKYAMSAEELRRLGLAVFDVPTVKFDAAEPKTAEPKTIDLGFEFKQPSKFSTKHPNLSKVVDKAKGGSIGGAVKRALGKESYTDTSDMEFSEVLESYLIPAEEGINIDTIKAIRGSSTYKELTLALKKIRSIEKSLKKDKKNISTWESLHDEYEKVIPLAKDLKELVDSQPEPIGFWERTLSVLTPILDFKFPESELTSGFIIPIPNGGIVKYSTKSVVDDLADGTDSRIKKSYQKRMNLFIVNTVKGFINAEKMIDKLKAEQE